MRLLPAALRCRALAFAFLLLLVGCGVPGPPVPPTPKIPVRARELSARQVGERVLLRVTPPWVYTDGTRIEGLPRLEVHRAFLSAAPASENEFAAAAQLAYVLPPQVAELFLRQGEVVFPDALGARMLKERAGRTAVYAIKATDEKGRAAGFSNLVALRIFPVAEPIARIETKVTETAIELRWEAPLKTTSGTPLEAIAGYQVYRSETGEEGSFVLHGVAPTPRYEDTQFRFGGRYYYFLRTLAQYGSDTVESENSATIEVTPRDVFPPPAPSNLIAVAGPRRVDLTWDASPAADLAGYHVYRSVQVGAGYERLTAKPLAAQSFADTRAAPGMRYYYVVTAVDADGNESRFSAEISVTPLPAE